MIDSQPPASAPPRIVIVGGGAAGLELATRLGERFGKRRRATITLVDHRRTHLWKPLLHAIAAGSLNPGDYELDYLAQAHWRGFRFAYGEMIGLDRSAKEIRLAASRDEDGREIAGPRRIAYDILVIAVGSVTNDFGARGAAEYAIPLDTPEQAARFNRRLVNACLRANAQDEPLRDGQLHVAIIGAGATGTELAAELHRTIGELLAFGLERIDPNKDVHIVLIEAANRILPSLPQRISDAAIRLLGGLNVEVRTGQKVDSVVGEGVRLADGTLIPAELTIWAAGIKAPSFLAGLDGLEVNRINQLVVGPTLQTTRDPNVFAIGDCAQAPLKDGTASVPPRAQAAHQQANHLYAQIPRLLAGETPSAFVYRDFGSLVSLGRHSAIGALMGFVVGKGLFVEGLLARLMYRSLYTMHEYALHGASKTLIGSLGRGLSRRAAPVVKLH